MTGDKKNATKQQIIAAAQNLFGTHGFKATSMSDIAGACKMSPANLYRFFPSKIEIGEAVILQHIAFSRKASELALGLPATAQEKLTRFVLETLEYNFEHFHGKGHLLELIEFISQKLPLLPKQHKKIKLETVVQILSEGQGSGEVVKAPVLLQARLLMMALNGFLFPHSLLVGGASLETLKEEAQTLVSILFVGVSRPTGDQT